MMNMKIAEIVNKMANLTKGKDIYFDHKSYDDVNDIPHIIINGERLDVSSIAIDIDGMSIYMTDGNMYDIGYRYEDFDISEEEMEGYLEEMGIYDLMQDVYYELEDSYKIGDFEIDFLKNDEN